jgi:hypothetical protein
MSSNLFRKGAISLALLLLPISAQADENQMTARVITVPNAPIILQRCRASVEMSANNRIVEMFYMNTFNRSSHDALGYSVEYKIFDREGTLIGQQAITLTFGAPLSNSDPQLIKTDTIGFDLSEEATAVGSISCKITDATFMGRREWRPGQRWPEPLQPIPAPPRESSDNDGPPDTQSNSRHPAAGAAQAPVKLSKLINSLFGVSGK